MRANEAWVRNVLKTSNRFSVPKYQRPYIWTPEDQLKLWAAITDQYAILKAGKGRSKPDRFIGAIVLAKDKHARDSASDPDRYAIVDGQQRLLTICTYLAALRDLIYLDPGGSDLNKFNSFTSKHLEVSLSSGARVLIISPQPPDYDAFEAVVQWREFDDEKHPLAVCYSNAVENVTALIRKEKVAFNSERLVRALIDRLAIVNIELDKSDNAHRVFYSLNSLGRPLSRAEKVKTVFSMLAGAQSDTLYDSYWAPMQKALGSVLKLEDYLLSKIIIEGHAINKPQLEATYIDKLGRFEGQPAKILTEARKLHDGVIYFRQAIGEEAIARSDISKIVQRLERWGVSPAWPLVTLILELSDKGRLSPAKAVRALKMVESLVVRRFVSGVPPNDLRSRLTDVTVKITHGPDLENALRTEFLLPVNRWYDDKEIARRILITTAYEPRRVKQLLLLFEWINAAKQGVQAPVLTTKEYHVDHIMPQAITHWVADLKKWKVSDVDDLLARRLHVLGNLTPLHGQANSAVSNQSLAVKTKDFYSKSALTITRDLKGKTEWVEESIDKRSKALAKIIVTTWKR